MIQLQNKFNSIQQVSIISDRRAGRKGMIEARNSPLGLTKFVNIACWLLKFSQKLYTSVMLMASSIRLFANNFSCFRFSLRLTGRCTYTINFIITRSRCIYIANQCGVCQCTYLDLKRDNTFQNSNFANVYILQNHATDSYIR